MPLNSKGLLIQLEHPTPRSHSTDKPRFGKQFAKRTSKEVTSISEPAAERLLNSSWPGSIRELRTVIEVKPYGVASD
jgi:transcriptional regulator of acetoin/glycerol metabolism